MNIGVIGVGRMGKPIVRRLVSAGHGVSAFDINAALGEGISAAGASWRSSAAEVAASSEAIVLSVPGPAEVDAVVYGPAGVLAGAERGAVLIQTSTIGPAQSRQLAGKCEPQGIDFLDAPVTGGVEAAEAGTLAIMVGGKAAVLERARVILEILGKRIFHLGPAGAGSAMKLVIQSVFLSQMAAFLESVSLGQEAGIPMDTMLAVIAESSAHHPMIGKRYTKIIENDLTPRLTVAAALKDMRLAMALWSEAGLDSLVGRAALRAYEQTAQAGFQDLDVIALRQIFRRRE